jgi:RNA polymerase sigma-70 factor (ECF subfamily)
LIESHQDSGFVDPLDIATIFAGWYHRREFFSGDFDSAGPLDAALFHILVGNRFSLHCRVMSALTHEITELLLSWSNGDKTALEELTPLVYPELRRLARHYMQRERSAHTLQTSALINEAYLRIVDQQKVEWHDRAHFFAVAAQVMRHILIDYARRHTRAKRGAGVTHVPLTETATVTRERAAEFVALDDALNRLAQIDPRKSQIIELKFFGGLTMEEIAEVLKLSTITIKREWRSARAWLHLELTGNPVL